MNLPDINPNLPCLRPLTHSRIGTRRLSCSTGSKSPHSSSTSSSTQLKNLHPIPVLIQLCIYPDEDYAYQTMKLLFSSRYHYSPNVCDEFGCNVLMYTLRYQRYKLFDFLLNETSLDLNLRSKDQQGNTILHYVVIYGKDDTTIMNILIEKFIKFGIDIDERNVFGFTPLLFAMFCGRYDLVLTLLTRTDASPFVRDYIQLTNMLGYIEIDAKHKEFLKTIQNNRLYSQDHCLTRESARFHIQLHKTLPPRSESPHQTVQHHSYMNFFENVFPQAVQDRSGSIRSLILKMLDKKHLSSDLTRLIQYINQRYPRINPLRKSATFRNPTTTKISFQCENSKTNVHNIFNLFDPDLRPKAGIPKLITAEHLQHGKTPNTFKRLGTKLTVLAALSRSQTVMHSINSSHRASGEIPSSMSLRETHIYDINSLSDKDKFKLLSAKALDYIDQHCVVSIRLDGTYIPPELRQLLDHKRPLHLNVTTQDAFSFETFKRCVTTYLSRERECDENNSGQGNWSIIDQGYQTTIIIGYVFDGIKGYNVSNYVFENLAYFIRCLRQQYRCMVTLSCESPVVKLSSKLTVSITHESPIIRHLAATYMQKSMISAVTQCEMYHVNLILHQSKFKSLV
ncbi:unnamed protein product [Rotaria sp. Silwood1]|nr:unnamed protein product [Rotaria sp. Silwood1]CAF3510058.1 unnamed protein product [Rotaria sp. Silwood1]CAF3515790.1 unnamed protein product [Rotaria sp. Silwood1]CAF4529404.1 unnamed protein product [Rotaria sp. Silwood1]CAF4626767.1 unnamed protein product [Rotaria sp. Silwood1]